MKRKIIRSARRKKTVSAELQGDVLVVRAPADIPEGELARMVDKLEARIAKKQGRASVSDAGLTRRAQELNRLYFGGALEWQSIRWVTNQRKRLGSCTPATRSIRISDRVAQLPPFVRDYILVHELAHLIEANHSARFWELVNRYPKTERARGYLMALGGEPLDDE